MPLSRHSVGTYSEMSSHATCQGRFGHTQSSQFAEPLWTDPGIKSGISGRELIIYFKKTKKRRWGIMVKHSPKILTSKEKAAMVS